MADSNDWRVTISLTDPAHLERARQSFSAHEVEEDVRRQLGRSVAIGAGDSQIFLYAGTENAARDAERVARDVLAGQGIQAEFALHRWHPIEEEWEDPDVASDLLGVPGGVLGACVQEDLRVARTDRDAAPKPAADVFLHLMRGKGLPRPFELGRVGQRDRHTPIVAVCHGRDFSAPTMRLAGRGHRPRWG